MEYQHQVSPREAHSNPQDDYILEKSSTYCGINPIKFICTQKEENQERKQEERRRIQERKKKL